MNKRTPLGDISNIVDGRPVESIVHDISRSAQKSNTLDTANKKATKRSPPQNIKCRNTDCAYELQASWKFCPICATSVQPQKTNFLDLSVTQFVDEVAAGEKVPGAGTVAAVVGMLATALTKTIAIVGINSPKVQQEGKPRLTQIRDLCATIQTELRRLAVEDSECFGDFYDATKPGQLLTPAVTEKFTKILTVPLTIAKKCAQLGQIVQEIRVLGSPSTAGDMATAFFCAQGALPALVKIMECNMDKMLARCDQYAPDKEFLDATIEEGKKLVADFPADFSCP